MKINLTEIEDGMGGLWFNYIHGENFGFLTRVPTNFEINNNDILIHKEIQEDARVPVLTYHIFLMDELIRTDAASVRQYLATQLENYINTHNKLPYATKFKKLQKKNEILFFLYNPDQYTEMNLRIPLRNLVSEELTQEQITDLMNKYELTIENPIISSSSQKTNTTAVTIKPILDGSLLEQVAQEGGGDTICVFDAEVVAMEKGTTVFEQHESVFYLTQLKGGTIAPDQKKETQHRNFEFINAKFSEKLTLDTGLKVSDKISFNAKLKRQGKQYLLQNIKKIAKT